MAEKIEDKIVEVKVMATERENEETGETFFTYKTVLKDGKKYDLRFKKTCEDRVPKKSCIAYVKASNISIDYKYQYPRVWIGDIEITKDFSVITGEKISELFDIVE